MKAFYRQRIPEFSCARKEYIYNLYIYIIYIHIYIHIKDKKLELNDLQLFQIYFDVKHKPTL